MSFFITKNTNKSAIGAFFIKRSYKILYTIKNYVESFNPQTGYMKFTTEKTAAAKIKKPEAIKLKKLLDHNKMFATIELA